jgi:hypothetical protein
MKIALVITGLGMGGAEHVVVNLADALAARGHTVKIAYLTGKAVVLPINSEIEINGSLSNSMQRYALYYEALDYLMNNPFYGIGFSNYVIISPRGYTPHSAYALIFSELGIMGGCLISLFWGILF